MSELVVAENEMDVRLEEEIERQINLGHKNPHDIYAQLVAHLGDELIDVVRPYLADFIADMARQKLNQERRTAVVKIRPKMLADPELKLKSLWVPSGHGPRQIIYKKIAEMTADDFEARADYMERLGRGVLAHAKWCSDVALMMRKQGVHTAGELLEFPELEAA